MTRQVDITKLSAKERKILDGKRDQAQKRRDANVAANVCLNENKKGTHGPATHGRRCKSCYDVHRGQSDAMPKLVVPRATPRPPRVGERLVLSPLLYTEIAEISCEAG